MAQTPSNQTTIRFWLPDPDDIARVLHLLEICGYADRSMAFDEASQSGESNSVFEITIRRCSMSAPQSWRDEVTLSEHLHDGIWQA